MTEIYHLKNDKCFKKCIIPWIGFNVKKLKIILFLEFLNPYILVLYIYVSTIYLN